MRALTCEGLGVEGDKGSCFIIQGRPGSTQDVQNSSKEKLASARRGTSGKGWTGEEAGCLRASARSSARHVKMCRVVMRRVWGDEPMKF